MKTNTLKSGVDGAVLLTTVCVLSVLTLMAVSYLFLLKDNNYFVSRDQSWNRALVVAEAGVEEAMAYINRGGATHGPQPFGAIWTASTNGYYYVPSVRSLSSGSYNVSLSSTNPDYVTITSVGTVTAPLSNAKISRTIQVNAKFSSGLDLAIAALLGVTLNGNNITIDSYDSSDTNDFPGGLWNKANRRDHGDVATLQGTNGFFSVGNANIMGTVHMAPGGTMNDVKVGPNGSVGDVPFVTGGGVGFENSTFFKDDMNEIFPDVAIPYTSGTSISPPAGGATNTLSGGQYYYNGNFTIPSGSTLQVGAYQYVQLYVTGNFTMKGGGQNASSINIQPGGTLVLYVGGPTNNPATSATFENVNSMGNANNFQFYGLPDCTSLSWSGNASYMGTVYAPEASFTLSGSGNTVTNDYQGACIVNSVTMNGRFNVHYDENLAREDIIGMFYADSWKELTSR